jgi:hypothetical protein
MPNRQRIHLFTTLAFSVLMMLLGCRASEKNPQNSNEPLEQVVQSKLGKEFMVEYNADRRFALCQQKRSDNDHARRVFNYFVIRMNDNKLVNEGSFIMGYAKWIDKNTIEVATSQEGRETLEIRKISIDTERQ